MERVLSGWGKGEPKLDTLRIALKTFAKIDENRQIQAQNKSWRKDPQVGGDARKRNVSQLEKVRLGNNNQRPVRRLKIVVDAVIYC